MKNVPPFQSLNEGQWSKCFALIDPKLREQGKVKQKLYADGLCEFMAAYGTIRPKKIWTSLHLHASKLQRDKRPFAYVYVVWQDQSYGYHMFRQRWVKHGGRWFTEVVGLIASRQNETAMAT